MQKEQFKVLIVDDQPAVIKALQILLDIYDLPHISASTPQEACEIVTAQTIGAVLQDMNFGPNETSGDEGVDLFRKLRAVDDSLPILLITAWASVESAVTLMKEGAADYIEKPWDDEKLITTLKNLLQLKELAVENAQLRSAFKASQDALKKQYDLRDIVYESRAMHDVVSLGLNVAKSDAPILITGPSGSGKECIADLIQANSPRKSGPFVRVNVGAIPENLMESELFGAEAGAYTGLSNRRLGHFETANGGTLFLDEIDALSLSGQVKLLRIIQSGELLRLGSSRECFVDVRVISATNANLKERISLGEFREDLYFRLNVIELNLPSLHERTDDILPLAMHFLRQYKCENNGPKDLSPAAERALLAHLWPGNVRELQNRLRRAVLVSKGSEISAMDLDLEDSNQRVASPTLKLDDGDLIEQRRAIVDALSEAGGVVAHAATKLGLSRQSLYRKMTKLGVQIERTPTSDSV
ncbi:MAG: sigma-54-dependent Fis family transcriptional regulator [Proteobacteria bacterium]|nr:sigma-54-dependent Fis family transcriptional regulator [Pseudomonadota bacterium]